MRGLTLHDTAFVATLSKKWTPLSIPNCVIWLANNEGLWQDTLGGTPVTANGQRIGVWADQSGNNLHVTSSGDHRPTYITNVLNGLPTARFGGTTHTLLAVNSALYRTARISLWMVFRTNTAARVIAVYPHNAAWTTPWYRWGFFTSSMNRLEIRWSGTQLFSANNTFNLSTWYIANTQDADAWRNGTKIIDGSASDLTYGESIAFRIGTTSTLGEGLNGDVAEVILYNRSLSADECNQVGGYLAKKFNLTWNAITL